MKFDMSEALGNAIEKEQLVMITTTVGSGDASFVCIVCEDRSDLDGFTVKVICSTKEFNRKISSIDHSGTYEQSMDRLLGIVDDARSSALECVNATFIYRSNIIAIDVLFVEEAERQLKEQFA